MSLLGKSTSSAWIVVVWMAFAASATVLSNSANAAPINYGDFTGTTVMYLDVTETANTPGDEEPLFGAPGIQGDQLDFDPAGFAASATPGSPDLTDGQLNFTLMGRSGATVSSFSIAEGGDYNLSGTGTTATQVTYGIGIANVTVLEVDGLALAVPIVLGAASASGGDDLSLGVDVNTPWALSIAYDVNAALTAAGVAFNGGATKLEVAINNTLGAINEPSSIAFIAKKDFRIDVETIPIPEPGTLLLLAAGTAAMTLHRRNRKTPC